MGKILLIAAAVSLSVAFWFGVGKVQAQTTGKSPVQMIAERFNLNQNDVRSVFDEHHSQMREIMKQSLSDRLDQAVKDGKLTEEKKKLLLDKLNEFKENFRSQRQAQKQNLQDWAGQNGVDIDSLRPYLGGRGMGMKHGGWWFK